MKKILFHSNDGKRHCPDGFAAALVAWQMFQDTAAYIPCVYGGEVPTYGPGDELIIVDFSFSRDVLLDMEKVCKSVLVLDHHKTAAEALQGLQFAVFDMFRSGAQIAWDYFCYDEPRPALINYVADRDLWRKELAQTEQVSRALASFPQDFEVWDTLAKLTNYVDFMARIGEPLYQDHLKAVESLKAGAVIRAFDDYTVYATHTDRYSLVSDALNDLCRQDHDIDFAINWWERDGKIKIDLRSVGDFDVSVVAKSFGGGGHKNAAGCEVAGNDPRVAELAKA